MLKALMIAITLLGLAPAARAEKFWCQGTGRFSAVQVRPVELAWSTQARTAILDQGKLKVQVYIDKANADESHYLGILVLELDKVGITEVRGARGSIKDQVQYTESATSQIICVPVPL